jgi:hypothetical protein
VFHDFSRQIAIVLMYGQNELIRLEGFEGKIQAFHYFVFAEFFHLPGPIIS